MRRRQVAKWGRIANERGLEIAILYAEVNRLRALHAALIQRAGWCYPGCGALDWTLDKFNKGVIVHKHACEWRTTAFCQTHPDGCPVDG